MSAILDSVRSAGISVHENSVDADAVLIWSVLWHGRMLANREIYRKYREQGRPVIVADIGTLHRGVTWKLAVNHITRQGYYGHTQDLDWDRPRKLGLSLQTGVAVKPAVLIAAQHSQSLQLENIVQEQWIDSVVQQLRKVTDRSIVIRPHPRCRLSSQQLPKNCVIEQPRKLAGTYDNYNIDYSYHAVVNYNSGPGIQAALAGTRPIVDQSSLASPVSIDMFGIEQPYLVDRELWLTQIAHTEYTLNEIKQGLWLKRIQPALTMA